jgi:hypothetical protein
MFECLNVQLFECLPAETSEGTRAGAKAGLSVRVFECLPAESGEGIRAGVKAGLSV